MSKGKLIGCSRVLRHGSEPATFRNRRDKYRKRSAGLGTVPCRAGAVSSGIAYVHFNGFYYFRRAIRCRAASVPIPVEIGLHPCKGAAPNGKMTTHGKIISKTHFFLFKKVLHKLHSATFSKKCHHRLSERQIVRANTLYKRTRF